MSRSEGKTTTTVKRGIIEYVLLTMLLIVIIVTAWTLLDNGLVDTLASLIDAPPR